MSAASFRRRAAAVAFGALACAAPPALGEVTVVLRDTGEAVKADSVLGDGYGLELRTGAARTVLGWDQVREVEGPTAVAGLGEYLDIGRDLWRARIRVERGDTQLAQPLLAKHWARFRNAEGPTAALVAEGLLRCALAAGDVRGAADPWLACLRHRSAGIVTRFPQLPAVIDAETGLLPELSPFIPASRRQEVVAACEAARASGDAGEVAARIVRIARGTAAGSKDETAAKTEPAAKGASRAVLALSLLEDIAGAADARALERAVGAFDRAFEEPPAHLAAWRLAAIGTCRARLARTMPGDRSLALSRAALELLAVPAAGLDRTGFVDAYALEEAARLLREAGDEASAAQIDALVAEKAADQRMTDNTQPSKR